MDSLIRTFTSLSACVIYDFLGLVTRLRQPPVSDANPPTVGLGHGNFVLMF